MKEINNKEENNLDILLNDNNGFVNSNEINSDNIFIDENYKNKLFHFSKFHTSYNRDSHIHNINIPHYSFYPYSDSYYSLNDSNRINLLEEKNELKKMSEYFKNELNRAKNENKIGKKYIQLLENQIYIEDPKSNKYKEYNKISLNGKKDFNYKEFKNKFNLFNKSINKYNTIISSKSIQLNNNLNNNNKLIYSTQLLNNIDNLIDYSTNDSYNNNINIKNTVKEKEKIFWGKENSYNNINILKKIKENEINIKNSNKNELCKDLNQNKNLTNYNIQKIDNNLNIRKKAKKYHNEGNIKSKGHPKINKLIKKPKKIDFHLNENIIKINNCSKLDKKSEQKIQYLNDKKNESFKKNNKLYAKRDNSEKGKISYGSAFKRNLKK